MKPDAKPGHNMQVFIDAELRQVKLQPYAAEEMEAWMVSVQVGNVRNNDPELLALQEPDQRTLFS